VSPTDSPHSATTTNRKPTSRLLHPRLFQLCVRSRQHRFGRARRGNAKNIHVHAGRQRGAHDQHDKTIVTFNVIKSSALVGGVSASTAQAFRAGIDTTTTWARPVRECL